MNEMSRESHVAILIRLCRSDFVTDGERIVRAWLCCESDAQEVGIAFLASSLSSKDAAILSSSAKAVLLRLQDDELGVGVGFPPDPDRYVSRDFLLALSRL
jgi:hypothetical protein